MYWWCKKSLSCHSDGQFEESTLGQQHQGGDHVFAVRNLEQMEKLVKKNVSPFVLNITLSVRLYLDPAAVLG